MHWCTDLGIDFWYCSTLVMVMKKKIDICSCLLYPVLLPSRIRCNPLFRTCTSMRMRNLTWLILHTLVHKVHKQKKTKTKQKARFKTQDREGETDSLRARVAVFHAKLEQILCCLISTGTSYCIACKIKRRTRCVLYFISLSDVYHCASAELS